MAPDLLRSILIVGGLLGILSTVLAFYKIITDKAKLEADLRKEIEMAKEDLEELKLEFKKILERMGDITNLKSQYDTMQRVFEKIDRKMDTFNEGLQKINIALERKQDRA